MLIVFNHYLFLTVLGLPGHLQAFSRRGEAASLVGEGRRSGCGARA